MEENLFKKYQHVIQKQTHQKQVIITYIQEKTTITILEEEFIIKDNEIIFQISSNKRSKLLQKNIYKHLYEKGFTVNL